MGISTTWGTTSQEQELDFPCDDLITNADAAYFRGVTIDAPPPTVFRWLCQLRIAPYSYNGGRQSPRQLTPGLEHLEIGQDVMRIFTLADFAFDRHLTIRTKRGQDTGGLFGDIGCTYLIVPINPSSCRLLVKLAVRYPLGVRGWMMRLFLPWGDLVMMRRQLLNLKSLAEQRSNDRRVRVPGPRYAIAPSHSRAALRVSNTPKESPRRSSATSSAN